MMFFLLLGILLGGVSVLFALENVTIVTVTLLDWQITAPLAIILFGTLLSGMVLTFLILAPAMIRDALHNYAIRREKEKTLATAYGNTPTAEPVVL